MSCRCPALFHLAPIIQSQAKLPSASPLASRTFFLRADFFSWSCCKEPRICLFLYSCTSRLGCLGWSRSVGQVQDSKEFHDGMPSTDASPRERLDSHDSLDSPSLWQDSPSRSGAASMWQTSTCGFAMQWHPIKSTSDIMSLTSSRGCLFSQKSYGEWTRNQVFFHPTGGQFGICSNWLFNHRIGSILLSRIQTSRLQTNLIIPAISKLALAITNNN